MAVSEHDRFELHRALEQAIGAERAATLMEHLPPVGWADVVTKRDLDPLGAILRLEMTSLGDGLRAEMHQTLTAQTRTLVVAMTGSQFTLAAVAFGAARLGH